MDDPERDLESLDGAGARFRRTDDEPARAIVG
jgi:hypothetical protein